MAASPPSGSVSADASAPAPSESGSADAASAAPASSPLYGFDAANAIRGAGLDGTGPRSERDYLDRLRGPGAEPVRYERKGSCCHFDTPSGIFGRGLLDMYEVRIEGQRKAITLYLNMYDPAIRPLRAPTGFRMID